MVMLKMGWQTAYCQGCTQTGTKQLTYFPMIFFRALARSFHWKTFTSFSMLRGFGSGNAMMTLKNSSLSAFPLDTVNGRNPSRFLRIRFFSSTVKFAATKCCSRLIVSTLVTKHSFLSSQNMQLMQKLFGGRSSAAIGENDVVIVLPVCVRLNCTSRLWASHSSSDQF